LAATVEIYPVRLHGVVSFYSANQIEQRQDLPAKNKIDDATISDRDFMSSQLNSAPDGKGAILN